MHTHIRHATWIATLLSVGLALSACKTAAPPQPPEESAAVPVAGAPAGAVQEKGYIIVPTWYGTDRKAADPNTFSSALTEAQKASMVFGGMRGSGAIQFGVARVSIPDDREPGEMNSPHFWEKENPQKHIVLLNLSNMAVGDWTADIRQKLSSHNSALIYVHGYNVDFRDATRRCAQMAVDLGFEGVPMFFSWPSLATTTAYPVDEATVEWSVPHLVTFLETAIKQTGAENVFIVAHSMGARAVARALERLQSDPVIVAKVKAAIFAAPDIDDGVFVNQIVGEIGDNFPITLYASAEDEAVRASRFLHYYPRSGGAISDISLTGETKITAIDASNVATDFLGHSYYASTKPLLGDIQQIMLGIPPESRTNIRRAPPSGGNSSSYWQFVPAD